MKQRIISLTLAVLMVLSLSQCVAYAVMDEKSMTCRK